MLPHIAEQLLVARGCLPVRAAKANGQTARGGSNLDIAQVLVGVVEEQKDLVVAIKVADGQTFGADSYAQVAQKDKGLALPLLQLTNLPFQRIGIGGVDAFVQHGAAKFGCLDLADGIELGVQSAV